MRTILAVVTASLVSSLQGADASRLEGRYWKAIELAGKQISVADASREPHLQLQSGHLSGADGCNAVTGSYELKGETIAFSKIAATQMACPNTAAYERAFHAAVAGTPRWKVSADRLELIDSDGTRTALFAARMNTTPSGHALQGSAWQLVAFRGGNDQTLTPDDGSKYTIAFDADGRLTARIDCNRGRGTWQSTAPNQLRFGPLAMTRMACPAGSMHDQIVKQFGNIRSYIIKDNHLFLSLMADGGIYEFQPITNQP